jgi:hypothetical protein
MLGVVCNYARVCMIIESNFKGISCKSSPDESKYFQLTPHD